MVGALTIRVGRNSFKEESYMKFKQRRKKLRHSYGCDCGHSWCAMAKMAEICEDIVRSDIPLFEADDLALTLNVHGCFLDFMEVHARSYNLDAVVEGREVIYGVPFVVRHCSPDQSSSGLTLFTPRPGHEWAFLVEHAQATGN